MGAAALHRRAIVVVLALCCVAPVLAACDGDSGDPQRAFAVSLNDINDRWVDNAERPLTDLVLRLASEPATIGEQRSEIALDLRIYLDFLDETLTDARALDPPSGLADECYRAEIERLETERAWLDMLFVAVSEGRDATATAHLAAFTDVARTIERADLACERFIAEIE